MSACPGDYGIIILLSIPYHTVKYCVVYRLSSHVCVCDAGKCILLYALGARVCTYVLVQSTICGMLFWGINYALQYDMRARHILLQLSFRRFIHSEQHDTKLVCTFQSVLVVAV